MPDESPRIRRGHFGQKYYRCRLCREEIDFSNLLYMSKIEEDHFTITYTCPCTKDSDTVRLKVDAEAIQRLLQGLRPRLPYYAADRPAPDWDGADGLALAVFAWECQQLQGVDDFLLWCSRPQQRG